ncbi:MAG TPA: glycosyltransferase family 4 protein [Bacteroidota bacterium]|nr:glycosyltransferase family 4 protein [Bacteroidota bacterium]
MNILVVNWQDVTHPLSGGAEVHFHEIFSRIARRGHQVTLCCCSFPGAAGREWIDGIEILRRGPRALFSFLFPYVYLRELRARSFDIVIEDLNKIPFFTPFYVKRPLAGIAHHLFRGSIFRETGPVVGSIVYGLESLALASYRTRMPFCVVSRSTADEFIRYGFPPERIAIVENCVDHQRYFVGNSAKSPAPLIGSFGRLKKYKSVDHFLQALPAVLTIVPDLKAVIAGDGDDLDRLKRMAADLGIRHSVEFTGRLTEDEKVRLLRSLWFTVNTSSKEGWGLTVVEANACGTPAIAADVPGLRDAVKDEETGLLYPYGDIAALSQKILRLLKHPDERQRLRENALVWAASFDWEHAADKTLAFLEPIVSQPTGISSFAGAPSGGSVS